MFCSYKMHQVYSWCNHSEEGPTETWNTILMVLEQAIIIFSQSCLTSLNLTKKLEK